MLVVFEFWAKATVGADLMRILSVGNRIGLDFRPIMMMMLVFLGLSCWKVMMLGLLRLSYLTVLLFNVGLACCIVSVVWHTLSAEFGMLLRVVIDSCVYELGRGS